jgi:dTDP-4-dehydrorhamnose reductase|tara:strand:- start:7132 stop:7974 length:843 start_codon:yes stop_codon:yes gene_type:complete
MKVLITGTSGMLGSAVLKEVKRFNLFYDVIEAGPSSERDLTNIQLTKDFVEAEKPDVIIHLAAITSLKKCKDNPDKAKTLHTDVTKILSKSCRRIIYISTDSVFDGCSDVPYSEISDTNPLNTYANTKLAGEAAARCNNDNSLVIRTNIFGRKPGMLADWALQSNKDNKEINGYVNTMFNPLYVGDLAMAIRKLIDHNMTGTINIAGNMCLSKYEFLKLLYKQFSMDAEMIRPITYDDTNEDIKRPKYTCLQTGIFEDEFGHSFSLSGGLSKLFDEYEET